MLRKILMLAALGAPLAAPAAAEDPLAEARAAFVEVLAAVPRGDTGANDGERLRAYPLYPYLEAERLRWQLAQRLLDDNIDERVRTLLQRDGDAVWTRALRTDWLHKLAERGQWPLFLAYDPNDGKDTALACERASALIATGGGSGAQQAGLALWRNGKSMPDACDPVFAWLEAQGVLGADEIAGRARLALEAGERGLARVLLRRLPEDRRGIYALWLDALENPRQVLPRALAQGLPPRAVFDGFQRLARSDPEVALDTLAQLERACGQPCTLQSPATPGELMREIALSESWSRLPEAVAHFRPVPVSALDERGHEWRVRAALWNGEWALAAQWIAQMPPDLAQQDRWRYWAARCADKLGRADAAAGGYARLALDNGYYSALAAERLGRAYAPHPGDYPHRPELETQYAAMPGVVRAREAWLAEQTGWAVAEWNAATRDFDPTQLISAARVASSWGWHLLAVATASRAKIYDDYALLYPRPYELELRGAARRARLPAQWIWGVLRQESLYDPRARSGANALGLLQLLPETARRTARNAGLDPPSPAQLYDPSTNLLLGAAYLREQYETFGGRFVLVLGAYNAGPNAVRRWLPPEPMDADVWIENVPYNETRSYIQRIVWHSTVFGWEASGGQPQRLGDWLAPISSDLTPLPGAALAADG